LIYERNQLACNSEIIACISGVEAVTKWDEKSISAALATEVSVQLEKVFEKILLSPSVEKDWGPMLALLVEKRQWSKL
jgi:hypothetical protein